MLSLALMWKRNSACAVAEALRVGCWATVAADSMRKIFVSTRPQLGVDEWTAGSVRLTRHRYHCRLLWSRRSDDCCCMCRFQ